MFILNLSSGCNTRLALKSDRFPCSSVKAVLNCSSELSRNAEQSRSVTFHFGIRLKRHVLRVSMIFGLLSHLAHIGAPFFNTDLTHWQRGTCYTGIKPENSWQARFTPNALHVPSSNWNVFCLVQSCIICIIAAIIFLSNRFSKGVWCNFFQRSAVFYAKFRPSWFKMDSCLKYN